MPGCAIDSVPLPEVGREDGGPDSTSGGSDGSGGDGTSVDPPGASTEVDLGPSSNLVQSNHIYYAFDPARSGGSPDGAPPQQGARVVATVGAVPAGVTLRLFPWGSSSAVGEAWEVQAQATAQGSFHAHIPASPGMRVAIELSQTVDGERSKIGTLVLALEPASVDASRAQLIEAELSSADPAPAPTPEADEAWPQHPDAGVIARAPNSTGDVLVQGGPGSLQLGTAVVVANPGNGSAQVAYPYADGSFAVRVSGAGGDSLELFVVEPATSNGGGSVLYVSVLTSFAAP